MIRAHNSRGWPDVTGTHALYYDGTAQSEIPFTETVPAKTELMLVGSNEDWALVHVAAHGLVDFH